MLINLLLSIPSGEPAGGYSCTYALGILIPYDFLICCPLAISSLNLFVSSVPSVGTEPVTKRNPCFSFLLISRCTGDDKRSSDVLMSFFPMEMN